MTPEIKLIVWLLVAIIAISVGGKTFIEVTDLQQIEIAKRNIAIETEAIDIIKQNMNETKESQEIVKDMISTQETIINNQQIIIHNQAKILEQVQQQHDNNNDTSSRVEITDE